MNRDELAEIEAAAIRRARELLRDWEQLPVDRCVSAAHAYAALALAAGQRIARTEGYR